MFTTGVSSTAARIVRVAACTIRVGAYAATAQCLALAAAYSQTPPPMDHAAMGKTAMVPDPLGVPMMRAGSGTTWVPDAVQLPTRGFMAGKWDLMVHGFVFAQYNKQGGARGDDGQFGSLNWGMFMASREVAGGRFQARTMLSVDAVTVGPRGYPLLVQSGEAYNGGAVHDRQHPHDFFMEVGATYERPITGNVGFSLYVAPSGEPALGPVAFMHRPSAMDMPTAPLGHHWQDATHVAFGVLSAGLFTHRWKVEGSVFNGREPNQHRWDFDKVALDSYSGRVTFNPTVHWSFTSGYGYLKSPEALHPSSPLHRSVSSAMYGRALGERGQWATTLVYGVNRHSSSQEEPGSGKTEYSQSVLVESEALLDSRNTVFGRMEVVQKSPEDLVLDEPGLMLLADRPFNVAAFSLGYVRELLAMRGATLGLGGMGTLNVLPAGLETWYGRRTPVGAVLFLRLRPGFTRGGMSSMPDMKH